MHVIDFCLDLVSVSPPLLDKHLSDLDTSVLSLGLWAFAFFECYLVVGLRS